VVHIFVVVGQVEWTWSLGLLWAIALVLFGGGFLLCGNVVSLGPLPPQQRSLGFRIGRMVMLLGLLIAVAAASVTVLALVN
jgi:hypothetical protein